VRFRPDSAPLMKDDVAFLMSRQCSSLLSSECAAKLVTVGPCQTRACCSSMHDAQRRITFAAK